MAVRLQYSFNEASGTTLLEASGGPSGVLDGNGARVTGKNGTAVSNINGGYASRAATVSGLASTLLTSTWTAWTLMCWVQVGSNGNSDYGTAVNSGGSDAWGISLPSATQAKFWFKSNTGTTDTPIYTHGLSSGTWMHLAATWSAASGVLKLFTDGVERSSTARGGSTINVDVDVIWLCGVPWTSPSTNPLDDFRLFDSAEDAASITTWMNTPVGGAPPAGKSFSFRRNPTRGLIMRGRR